MVPHAGLKEFTTSHQTLDETSVSVLNGVRLDLTSKVKAQPNKRLTNRIGSCDHAFLSAVLWGSSADSGIMHHKSIVNLLHRIFTSLDSSNKFCLSFVISQPPRPAYVREWSCIKLTIYQLPQTRTDATLQTPLPRLCWINSGCDYLVA